MGQSRGYKEKIDLVEKPLNSRHTDKFGPSKLKKFGLMLGHANRQTTVHHPASNGFLQVPNTRELSRIAAACACAERKSLPDALACVDASLSDLPQNVYVAVLGLIDTIMSVPADDVTEQTLEQLQRICKRAGGFDGKYASWLAVALAHAAHQRKAVSSAVPLGHGVLQAAV
jgi:hypothetical protein